MVASSCGLITPFEDRPTPQIDGDGDTDADSDGDGDVDADGDGDGDPDADSDAEVETCVPDCEGRECGPDRCGGSCGAGCTGSLICSGGGCQAPAAGQWIEVTVETFMMGSPESERGHQANETLHQVTLTHDFVMLSTEVNQIQFETWMGYSNSYFSDEGPGSICGVDCPAERVTWSEAAAACNVISSADGLDPCYECEGSGMNISCTFSSAYSNPYVCPGYRLPTEAEWEYAARAGTTTATFSGDLESGRADCENSNAMLSQICWYCFNSGEMPHPVAQLNPNAWGLHDMLGNVWEWVHDRCETGGRDQCQDYMTEPVIDPFGNQSASNQAIRSGGFSSNAVLMRSAWRGLASYERNNNIGFRPVRTLFP